MLTTTPRLRIRRPSPTAAEFTVTTLPPQTVTLRILRFLLLLIRLGLSLLILLLLHARWVASPLATPLAPAAPASPPFPSLALLWHTVAAYRRSVLGLLLSRAASAAPLPALLPCAAAAFYMLSKRAYARESLLVLRGLGVQTSESPGTYLAGAATRFIPTEKIQDIFINEAFRGFEVRYYLVVVVDGEEDVVVVFPGLLPKRSIVEAVWRGARECLYEGRVEEKGTGV